jgi:outer membrane protein OmpA-like peptidoglycan-associated protein
MVIIWNGKENEMRKYLILLVALLFVAAAACQGPQTKTGKGAAYGAAGGAAVGALAGQAIGGDTEGTLLGAGIGAAAGAAAGAGVGKMMDKQEAEMRRELAASNAAQVQREGDLLAVTLKGDVTFPTGSATVQPGMHDELNRIASILQRYPQTRIQVEGHTDSVGSNAANMDLSQRRADAVKNLLVQKGVAPGRINTVAYGESQPIAPNDTAAGRQRNRRVEIKIAPTQAGA